MIPLNVHLSEVSDQDRQQREALREAILETMRTPGWKEIRKILDEVKESPVKTLDNLTLSEVSFTHSGFIKGVRSAIRTIDGKIEFILNGG